MFSCIQNHAELLHSREIGDQGFIGSAYRLLGQLAFQHGDENTAHALFEESLAIHRERGNKSGIAFLHSLLGQVALQRGNAATAEALFEESLAIHRAVGNRQCVAESLAHLARTAVWRDDNAAARALYDESLMQARELGNKRTIALCLEGLAGVILAQGEAAWAARLLGAAEALRKAIGVPMQPVERIGYEQAVMTSHNHLGERYFSVAWAEGRTMTPEQAFAARGPVAISVEPAATPQTKSPPAYPAGLTAREVEVLRLVAQGLPDAQVAAQLVVSPRTVNFHLTSIYGKIGVSSRSAATRFAIEQHLI